ncbi:type II secretion system protein [Roseiconus lacunae]|uniref:type II secretion system protein n=1 Tax=Roseiconus lacunae TaxID=2605694 RepID=UPI0011F22E30|nr:type II secretion system protein [Roseiconus lacunae]
MLKGRPQATRLTVSHRAMSLIELIVVLSLLGVFATAAMARFGRNTLGDTGARSEATVFANTLSYAQAAAIRTGRRHGVVLTGDDDRQLLTVRESFGGGQQTLDEHVISTDVAVKASHDRIWFNFEGHGTSPISVTFSGKHRRFQVTAVPLSQSVRVSEL